MTIHVLTGIVIYGLLRCARNDEGAFMLAMTVMLKFIIITRTRSQDYGHG